MKPLYALICTAAVCCALAGPVLSQPDANSEELRKSQQSIQRLKKAVEQSEIERRKKRSVLFAQREERKRKAEACTLEHVVELEQAGTAIDAIGELAVSNCSDEWHAFAAAEASNPRYEEINAMAIIWPGIVRKQKSEWSLKAAKLRNQRLNPSAPPSPERKSQSL